MNYRLTHLKPFGVLIEPKEGKGHKTNTRDVDVEILRKLFNEEHLLLLRGFSNFEKPEDLVSYCEKWGEVSIWPFGKVLELQEQDRPEDHIFDHSYVPLHWDGMYRPQVPEYQIFHCVKAPLQGQGGRTTFSNTILALEHVSNDLKELWNKVTGVYQRKMEFYNSKITSPIVVKHPIKNYNVIRYNEPPSEARGTFINPPELKFTGIEDKELSMFHQSLISALYDPKNYYAHEWQDNDIVIADNFSLLHGREEFISKSPRHLRRVQVLSNPVFDNPGLESYQ